MQSREKHSSVAGVPLVADGPFQPKSSRAFTSLPGRTVHGLSRGEMAYQLRRLRLHETIERVPQSHGYRIIDFGLRTALFCTRTYTRILPPGLAPALPEIPCANSSLRRRDVVIQELERIGGVLDQSEIRQNEHRGTQPGQYRDAALQRSWCGRRWKNPDRAKKRQYPRQSLGPPK